MLNEFRLLLQNEMLRIDKAPNPIDTFVIQVSTPCVFIINRYDARKLNCIFPLPMYVPHS